MCQQFDVTTRFQEGEFRQHQIKRNSSGLPTCPASRAQTANFALTLDMSATSFQLIWTAVTENTRLIPSFSGKDSGVGADGHFCFTSARYLRCWLAPARGRLTSSRKAC